MKVNRGGKVWNGPEESERERKKESKKPDLCFTLMALASGQCFCELEEQTWPTSSVYEKSWDQFSGLFDVEESANTSY